QTQSLKIQTSLDSFFSYESITENEGSSSEEPDDDLIYEQYEALTEAFSSTTISRSLQILAKRKNIIPTYRKKSSES
ncbi:8605_t:CDS:1, partial [Racocetra persica]